MKEIKAKILERLRAVLRMMGMLNETQIPQPEVRTTHIHYDPHSKEPRSKNNSSIGSNAPINRMQNK